MEPKNAVDERCCPPTVFVDLPHILIGLLGWCRAKAVNRSKQKMTSDDIFIAEQGVFGQISFHLRPFYK